MKTMKIPLRYQNTEYDCGTTSFVNALAYLYEREDIPIELLKAIYRFTLDVKDQEGITGKGGTSRKHSELLADYFVEYANKNDNFDIKCKIFRGEEANLENMQEALNKNAVIIARCWQDGEHYVLITKINNNFAYIFDPYYLEENYYDNDEDVAMVFHEEFTHNRLVKVDRLLGEAHKDFSLMEKNRRSIILLSRQ